MVYFYKTLILTNLILKDDNELFILSIKSIIAQCFLIHMNNYYLSILGKKTNKRIMLKFYIRYPNVIIEQFTIFLCFYNTLKCDTCILNIKHNK